MGIKNKFKSIAGVVNVQIEGFFTERFINLCKSNNISIWNIRNIVNGMVRFDMYISDFKKLKTIAKKTKCKVHIRIKKGLYFVKFKYRKRKVFIILILLLVALSIIFSNFIWKIDVVGNENVTKETILQNFENNGLKIGTFKVGLDKSEIIKKVRAENREFTWIGVDINGTSATIKVIEKTKLKDENIQEERIGDIVANKDALITRIIAENGTAKVKEGSFVEKGMTLIEGIIYSTILENREVSAKGIIYGNVEYVNNFEYFYKKMDKEYTNKKRWNVGITINSKEYMINYLNKSHKYDKIKNSKSFNIFGLDISFDLYSFDEYTENEVVLSKEDIEKEANLDIDNYLNNELLSKLKNATLVRKDIEKKEYEDKVVYETKYVINEQIGEFVSKYE